MAFHQAIIIPQKTLISLLPLPINLIFAEYMAQSVLSKQIRLFALSLALFLFFVPIVSAETEGSFSVSPLFTDILLGAEEEQNFSLEVGNTTSEPMVFRVSFVDFGSLNESGGIAFLGKGTSFQERYGLASWISAERDVVTVFPQGKEQINFTVMNKESLSPGGHYGAVVFQAAKEGEDFTNANSNVSISPNFTALVFVRKIGGEILDFQYRESIVRRDLFGIPDKISLRFQNKGNIHVTPRGRIEVRDMLGNIVRKGILNEESGRILPESYRVYPISFISLSKAILPGYYHVSGEYRFDGEENFSPLPEQKFFAWGVSLVWLLTVSTLCYGAFFFRKKSVLK